ncbi:hypothetical protein ABZ869_04260 [Streptomyces sp. NPDC046928]|uniref:hypothetical protein n=1 Tax=Streptomyces sp. NPDC046928 TaxID=3155021 RepID=UPI0033F3A233
MPSAQSRTAALLVPGVALLAGTRPEQREAVGRVQRIIRVGEKGDACFSTGINGGREF